MADTRPAKRRKLVISSSPSEDEGNALRPNLILESQERVALWTDNLAGASSAHAPVSVNVSALPTPRDTSLEGTTEREVSLDQSEIDAAISNRGFVQIPRPSLPAAAFYGWNPPENTVSEARALTELVDELPWSADGSRYIELDQFTIYRPNSAHRGMEMCTLDRLQAVRADELCFSGYLSVGKAKAKHFVHDVRFRDLAIDGYGDPDCASVHDKMCIQSSMAQYRDVWYRLRRPSAEYKGFYDPFLWLATFTKYFVDYLLNEPSVTMRHFRASFAARLRSKYGRFACFHSWHEQCDFQHDFRTSVAAYMVFLYKECFSISNHSTNLFRHPIWNEAYPTSLDAITTQDPISNDDATVVTPFAHRCFQGMYFASHLTVKKPDLSVIARIVERKRELCLTPWHSAPTKKPQPSLVSRIVEVHQGDVVCISPDKTSDWKLSNSELWYAYVQKVQEAEDGAQVLDVLWLYEAADTTLDIAHYPFQNELFLSDICDCGKTAIPIEDVVAKVTVSWFVVDPHSVSESFFVRQKYHDKVEEDRRYFTTLTAYDFCCAHANEFSHDSLTSYRPGESVLVKPRVVSDPDALLEPARVIRFDQDRQKFILRKLFRSADSNPVAYKNELEDSYEESSARPSRIIRRCKIAYFASRSEVVTPYDRGGAGDYFFILEKDVNKNPEGCLETPPASERGPDPETTSPPLIGLGLYCGGGNFDRGLEEAGAVKFKHAIDWEPAALHSYRANVDNPDDVQYFLGSVNNYLHRAMRDSKSGKIALPGRIGLISGGSPCPGFSNMQIDKQSDSSLKFASMVASVVAFVDFYNPEYLVLENVVSMGASLTVDGKQQNVFRQILAALVALGYQVQHFLMDAWTVGSPQQRSRLFIVASAPSTAPLPTPPMTHAHPPGFRSRSLGKTANGLSFGQRRDHFTPFHHVSPKESCQDLPDIGNSLPQICPQFPDHRLSTHESPVVLQRLARVPTHPYGMGLCQAISSGRVTSGEAYEWMKKSGPVRSNPSSRAYARVRPNDLFPTMLTALTLQCGKNGNFMHWNEHRPISILEARRAQGFPDHEVIVGTPLQQMKIVGNSVDRKVSFTMGLALKESRDATLNANRLNFEGDDDVANDAQYLEKEDSRLQPSPAQVKAMRNKLVQERRASEGLVRIIRTLRSKEEVHVVQGRECTPPPPAEWAAEDMDVDASLRWAGDSPADALAVRRRANELDTVIRLQVNETYE